MNHFRFSTNESFIRNRCLHTRLWLNSNRTRISDQAGWWIGYGLKGSLHFQSKQWLIAGFLYLWQKKIKWQLPRATTAMKIISKASHYNFSNKVKKWYAQHLPFFHAQPSLLKKAIDGSPLIFNNLDWTLDYRL